METILVMYCILCISINTLHLFIVSFDFKYPIVIKLWKSKKYQTKVDPIYKLYQDELNNSYCIMKYKLEWHKDLSLVLLCLFPYPIEFKRFGYLKQDSYFIGTDTSIHSINDLATEYERLHQIRLAKCMLHLTKQQIKENKISQLNKIFNENYEKI